MDTFCSPRPIAGLRLELISARRTRSFLTHAARVGKPIHVTSFSGGRAASPIPSVGVRIDSDPTITFSPLAYTSVCVVNLASPVPCGKVSTFSTRLFKGF